MKGRQHTKKAPGVVKMTRVILLVTSFCSERCGADEPVNKVMSIDDGLGEAFFSQLNDWCCSDVHSHRWTLKYVGQRLDHPGCS